MITLDLFHRIGYHYKAADKSLVWRLHKALALKRPQGVGLKGLTTTFLAFSFKASMILHCLYYIKDLIAFLSLFMLMIPLSLVILYASFRISLTSCILNLLNNLAPLITFLVFKSSLSLMVSPLTWPLLKGFPLPWSPTLNYPNTGLTVWLILLFTDLPLVPCTMLLLQFTRPEISYAGNKTSQFMSQSLEEHWKSGRQSSSF